jgi:hypothetical protein
MNAAAANQHPLSGGCVLANGNGNGCSGQFQQGRLHIAGISSGQRRQFGIQPVED